MVLCTGKYLSKIMSKSTEKHVLFKSLHEQYYPMVKQLCLGYMKGDTYAAEDIAQDVFINIWNGFDNFRSEASYKTWIYRISVNTCLLHIRNNKKKQATTELNEVHFESTQEATYSEERFLSLYKAIGELPPVDRLIMMMVLEELPYEEIGTITGISQVHLRVKIYRIKNKIREKIKQY
jgi:RNA polymerase sigma-70 factor (ECF subfamily)